MVKKLKFPLMAPRVERVPFGEFDEEIELFTFTSKNNLSN
jgi:hypothetical protein